MTLKDNCGVSKINTNGLNMVRDINTWLRYEIKGKFLVTVLYIYAGDTLQYIITFKEDCLY